MNRTWRHKVRGSLYVERGRGTLQSAKPVVEGTILVAYRDIVTGTWYFRPEAEFLDGRFEEKGDTLGYTINIDFSTKDGNPFSDEQRQDIAKRVDELILKEFRVTPQTEPAFEVIQCPDCRVLNGHSSVRLVPCPKHTVAT